MLEKLDLHIIYIHGFDSINWEQTSTIIAVCATVCTVKRSKLNELQMQYSFYTCVRNTLQGWEVEGECKTAIVISMFNSLFVLSGCEYSYFSLLLDKLVISQRTVNHSKINLVPQT